MGSKIFQVSIVENIIKKMKRKKLLEWEFIVYNIHTVLPSYRIKEKYSRTLNARVIYTCVLYLFSFRFLYDLLNNIFICMFLFLIYVPEQV